MGMYFQFKKYGRRAIRKEREQRIVKAEENAKKSEESWKSSAELSKIREFKERQKLENLAKYGLSAPDPQTNVSFSKNIEDAEREIGKKLENKDWNKVKDKKVEEKVENADNPFSFKGVILGAGDRIELTESESDFELSDEDKKGMGNLLKLLKKGKNIKLIPMNVKTINLSAN